MTQSLIDGDIVAYRCAASAENDPLEISILRTDTLMREILYETGADTYKLFISPDKNFRYDIYPFYKANRTQPRPKHLYETKIFLTNTWYAETGNHVEADDMLGINQSNDTIICSIDKDLLQIPGQHYNFVKKEFQTISVFQGLYNFYKQLLMGDRTDNIYGIDGIGPKKADKILAHCTTEDEMFDAVRDAYSNDDLMYLYGRLLWLLRKEGDIWNPPQISKLCLGQGPLPHEQEAEFAFMETLTTTE